MFFYNPADRKEKDLITGIHARTFWGEKMMLVIVELDANTTFPKHNHPHEQGGIVLEGELEFIIGSETRLLHPGDLYIIPGGVDHEVKVAGTPAKVLDIFSPVREEYKY
jgi:quercetin dioxygenase-like cupin family protein